MAPLKSRSRPAGTFSVLQGLSDNEATSMLAKKIQSGMGEKRKEKEAQFLAKYKEELTNVNAHAASEFDGYSDQIDQAFEEFTLAYAKIENKLRAIWSKIMTTHSLSIEQSTQQLASETRMDKEREDQQVWSIACHMTADEAMERVLEELTAEKEIAQ